MNTTDRQRIIRTLTNRDGFKCHYCGEPLQENDPQTYNPRGVSLDHIVPQIEGGSSGIDNLVLACRQCNGMKKTKHYHEYRFAKETDLMLLFLMGGG